MKHKVELRITGKKVILVPYKEQHVHKYHEWMGDEEILRLTGSERLTLEEEFDMQKKWEQDLDKCTFIILWKEKFETSQNELESIVGDTNLFLNVEDDPSVAEIEIMIAEKSARRQGFAYEALMLMMKFGKETLNKDKFVAKIKQDNASSIKLFEALGYKFVSKNKVFQEITLLFDEKVI